MDFWTILVGALVVENVINSFKPCYVLPFGCRASSIKSCVYTNESWSPSKDLALTSGRPSPPSEEALFAIATFEWLLLEQLHIFEHVVLRIAAVRSFAVSTLAYTSRVVLVTAICTSKQSWVGTGSFTMAVWAFGWIILWQRRRDAERLVAAGRATLACVGSWAVEGLVFLLLALLSTLR